MIVLENHFCIVIPVPHEDCSPGHPSGHSAMPWTHNKVSRAVIEPSVGTRGVAQISMKGDRGVAQSERVNIRMHPMANSA